MMNPLSLFCDECGAANPQHASNCFACRQPLALDSPSPPLSVHEPARQAAFIPPPSVGDLQRGSVLVQRYQIIERIGEGGFGMVYKARDQLYKHKLVAVKQLNLEALNVEEIIDVTDTYNREVTLLSALDHANLPHISDQFTDAHHWYLVMDFIEGETLEVYLKKKRRGTLRVKEILNIGITLCTVLNYLHTRNPPIIFRDLKPDNIMRTSRGNLYLIDFGIARRFTPGQARDTGALGSPGYAAPEQYGKAQTTVQTDIYGLGATLYTLLTGSPPLPLGLTQPQAHRGKRGKLNKLLLHMLERDAGNRPKHMDEVKQQLQRIRGGIIGPVAKRARDFMLGLLIGSLPYALFLLMYVFASYFPHLSLPVRDLGTLLSLGLLCSWPVIFLFQLIIGIRCCMSSGKRLTGLGILSMMLFISPSVIFAWPVALPPFH